MSGRKSSLSPFTSTSEQNALDYLMLTKILTTVHTAIPVRVDKVVRPNHSGGAGYLSATPLIMQVDNEGNGLPQVSIPKLRWFRYQAGTCAIICDPKAGDVGLAVFAQRDVSVLTGGNEPKRPDTYRAFDMSDGFYIGGYWGQIPQTYIEINDGQVEIKANVHIIGKVTTTDTITADKDIITKANVTATGDVSGKSISLSSHVHGGVESGSSTTSTPQ